jgi:hypothetical protein
LQQRDRLAPKFDNLERVFESKLVHLQNNSAGLAPEQTLVLETIGRVEEFYKALRGVHGLEWMGEFDLEDLAPDRDFYNVGSVEDLLQGRVYLVLHNQEGLSQLRSLWMIFKNNPEHPQFKMGRAKFGNLFRQLKDIRLWGPEDRLRDTGLLEDWQERVAAGQEVMRVELELWSRSRSWERTKVEGWVGALIEGHGGRVLGKFDAAEAIAYHALLAELPIQAVQEILQEPSVELARCEQVMFLRPAGQVIVELPPRSPETSFVPVESFELPVGEPIAALLDGLPLANHELLAGRLIVDDPDHWEEQYPASARNHGTAMASLILHSELDAPGAPLSRPLYVRPVMRPDPEGLAGEAIPRNLLTVDLIHRAVLRILERDRDGPPAAPRVRVINLSLGDRARPFDSYLSPWARMLDHLASKYNVLFIVSAGNHPQRIALSIPRSESGALLADSERLQGEVLRSICDDNRHRRVLSPAEAINVLTVGALNADSSPESPLPAGVCDPLAGMALPALYNSQGFGFRRAVKPEVLFPGGRLLYRESYGTGVASLDPIDSGRPPGQKVASPGSSPGNLAAVRYIRGTSNAAALVTRVACQLYDVLDELRTTTEGPGLEDDNLAVLIRALLVHGCSWGDSPAVLERHLGGQGGGEYTSRICGFGNLAAAKVLACTEQRVTLLGWGAIREGQAFAYDLPLPASLNGQRVSRRLTTTLAWFSPIHPRDQRYRRAHVWLTRYLGNRREDDAVGRLGLGSVGADWRLAQRGTVQHQIYEGERADPYSEDEALTFQVNCRSDAGMLDGYVRYGLAITLEVAENSGLSIYDEIRTRIRAPIAPRIAP